MSAFMVFIGGGCGALCRYGLGKWLYSPTNGFPLSTFVSNLISCLILGAFLAYFMNSGQSKYQLLIVTGFCGGFSTFSSFSAETFSLIQSGNYSLALIYIFLSVIICLLAILTGIKLFSPILS